jgi:hypothetical protein
MDNSTIEQINKIFKTKKLTWCGNFLTVGDPDQELEKGVCYDFTFQINKVKPMISVGEWTDFAIVDVTLYIKEDTILGRLVSGEYSDFFSGDNNELIRFYPLKNNIAQKIREALKLVSNLDVVVESIKPVLVTKNKNTEPIMEQRTNRNKVREIVRNISFDLKNDLHSTRMKNLGSFDVGFDDPIDVELYVNYPVVFDKRKRNKKNQELLKPYNVEGHWDDDVYAIRIIVNIDSQADLSMMYDLIGELNDVVTHELEHVNQSKGGYEFPEKEYEQDKRYYLQQHEIEAQVVGFKRKAKLQKRPIEEVIREYFERRKIRKDLINLFVERLMEHYRTFN